MSNNAERNSRIIQAMEQETKKITRSKKSARAYLIKLGIYTEDGKLAKEYGGE